MPLKLTTDERLSNVEATCLDFTNNGVKHSAQSLTPEQQAQARANIGAIAISDIPKDTMPNNGTAANHNGIFRGNDLIAEFGSIDALSTEVRAGDFSNIYIGDYFDTTINTSYGGSEQIRLVVAGIDTYWHVGDQGNGVETHHLTMITKDCFKTKHVMNPTDTSVGGYKVTEMHTKTLPVYATAIKNAIGASHILNHRELISNSMNKDIASMAGNGWMGATNGCEWVSTDLVLPSEVQVYGSTVLSSSFYDVANRNRQLPYFALAQDSLVCGLGYGGPRCDWWLSAVTLATAFAYVGYRGNAGNAGASGTWVAVRPLLLFA